MTDRAGGRAGEVPGEAQRDPLESGVEALVALPGVRRAVAVDRAGRVVAWSGIEDRATLTRLGALTAGVHAIAARLSEVAGDPGRSRIRLHTEEGVVVLHPLAFPSTRILLIVLEEGVTELGPRVSRCLEEMAVPDHRPLEVFDPRAFEASLALPSRLEDEPGSGAAARPLHEPEPAREPESDPEPEEQP